MAKRKQPKSDVLRALFSRSGNQCAFPGCTQPLINKKNQLIAQVCHIEAALEGGERYNPDSDDEYRRSYENLLILCYPHHIETNDIEEYSVERLKQIKYEHEQKFEKSDFKINESELMKLTYEMEKYWNEIDNLNKVNHKLLDSGLAMEVNGKSTFFELILSIDEAINSLENLLTELKDSDEKLIEDFQQLLSKKNINPEIFDDIPYYENPFVNKNWEFHNLGVPNWLKRLRIDIIHIQVKYLEEYLKTYSNDLIAKNKFEYIKKLLKDDANTAIHID